MPTLALSLCLSLLLQGDEAQRADAYEVPYEKLSEKHAKKVRKVMEDVTVEVPLEKTNVSSRSDLYDFLLEELPFTAGIVRELGKAKYEVFRDDYHRTKTEEEKRAYRHTYYLDDTEGLSLKVELVLAEKNRRIFYTYGNYDLAPLPKVWGRSVIIVTWREKDGKLETEARVYARVETDLYRAFSDLFKSTIEKVIREKSTVFIKAAKTVTEMAAKEPKKLYESVKDSKEVDSELLAEFRKRFLDK